jgi:hypothetical protein
MNSTLTRTDGPVTYVPDDAVAYVPGYGEIRVGDLRGESVRYVTTVEAARLFSYRPETWARWAGEGVIRGAYRDRMWRLPLAEVEAHIARLSEPRRRKRHPWDRPEAKASHAVGQRPSHLAVR